MKRLVENKHHLLHLSWWCPLARLPVSIFCTCSVKRCCFCPCSFLKVWIPLQGWRRADLDQFWCSSSSLWFGDLEGGVSDVSVVESKCSSSALKCTETNLRRVQDAHIHFEYDAGVGTHLSERRTFMNLRHFGVTQLALKHPEALK